MQNIHSPELKSYGIVDGNWDWAQDERHQEHDEISSVPPDQGSPAERWGLEHRRWPISLLLLCCSDDLLPTRWRIDMGSHL